MKDGFEKAKDVAQIIALVAVPIIVGLIGWQIQTSLKDREISRDYVQLAVSILSSKESPEELREWSAELVNNFSPVKLSDDALQGLILGDLSLPKNAGLIMEDFLRNSSLLQLEEFELMVSEFSKRISERREQNKESYEAVK